MNYYAQGGQAQGIKSLAKELPNYGRYNDDMVAHISSDEARLLKSLGGAGTINPVTGLPEYGFKKVWKNTVGRVEDIAKPITKPITDAVKPILPYVQYIAPFIPGVNAAYAAAMGALGSGFAGGGGFNFKRGLMGGMTAYGLSNLYAGMQAAGGATPGSSIPSTDIAAANVTPDPIAALNQSQGFTGVGEAELLNSVNPSGISSVASDFSTQMGNAGQGIKNLTGLGETTLTSGDALKAAGGQFGTGSAMGIYGGVTGTAALNEYDKMKDEADLAAAKDETERAAIMDRIEKSRQRGVEAIKANPYQFAYGGPVDDETGFDDFNNYAGGGVGMAKGGDVEEYLNRRALEADVPESRERTTRFSVLPSAFDAERKMIAGRIGADYPVGKTGNMSAGVSGVAGKTPQGIRAMANSADVGVSGNVGPGIASARMIRDLMGKQNRYELGYNIPFNEGGMTPRFLSGGGDGMSDDIKATINGKQPARLADGEFVIPADVVSHLGNGSSKAGAKKLYSMMDRVRHARTGNKKQGKQINPNKFLLA
jgi:hypothetical protein